MEFIETDDKNINDQNIIQNSSKNIIKNENNEIIDKNVDETKNNNNLKINLSPVNKITKEN